MKYDLLVQGVFKKPADKQLCVIIGPLEDTPLDGIRDQILFLSIDLVVVIKPRDTPAHLLEEVLFDALFIIVINLFEVYALVSL